MKRGVRIGREEAESIAVQALGWLSADPDRLGRFLVESGLDPATIRQAADEPGFLAAVLEHILGDEARVTEFAADHELSPAAIGIARARIAGPQWERDIP